MKYQIIDIGRDASAAEVVAALANNKVVESIVKSMDNSSTTEDLIQDIYLQLLSDPKTVDLYLKKELQYYIVGIARNSIFSKSSKYYIKYKKFNSLCTNDQIERYENKIEC